MYTIDTDAPRRLIAVTLGGMMSLDEVGAYIDDLRRAIIAARLTAGYAMVIDDGVVTGWFEEPGINDEGTDEDPYGETAPDKVLEWLDANPR